MRSSAFSHEGTVTRQDANVQQTQDAGMRTAQFDQIVRQRDPELLRTVEHLAQNETNAAWPRFVSRAGSPRFLTDQNASRSSPATTPASPKARSSSLRTTRVANSLMEQCAWN